MSDRNSGTTSSVAGLTALFGALYFIQSVGDPTSGLIAQPVRSLLDRWGESPTTIAAFMALLSLPWALKPLLALLADFVPLFGSRRRNYLLGATAAAAIGLAVAYLYPASPGDRWLLLTLLFVPTLGIAFTDVLADALMIEVGQPRRLTGRLQSAQWFAAWLALLLAGVMGGWLTTHDRHALAFLFCAALWTVSLALAWLFVSEPVHSGVAERRATAAALRRAASVPGLATIALVSFLWDCNPLSPTVHYLHVTRTLGLSEQAYGNAFSFFSAGAMLATAAYAIYCRRLGPPVLLHSAVAAGIVGNVLYWWATDAVSLYVVSTLVGLAYMTGSLVLLDFAARIVPVAAAATVFAVIMALASLGSAVGESIGGFFYGNALATLAPTSAYRATLVLASAVIACCWVWVPRLLRQIALHERDTD